MSIGESVAAGPQTADVAPGVSAGDGGAVTIQPNPPAPASRERRRAAVTSLHVDANEAAALIGIARRTWWLWHSAGKLGPLPVLRVGRVVRWSRQELLDWMAAGAPARNRWQAILAQRSRRPMRLASGM